MQNRRIKPSAPAPPSEVEHDNNKISDTDDMTDDHHHHHHDHESDEDMSFSARLIRLVKLVLIWTSLVLAGIYMIGRFRTMGSLRQSSSLSTATDGIVLTPAVLASFDGSDPEKPVLISIKGNIIDVSSEKHLLYVHRNR